MKEEELHKKVMNNPQGEELENEGGITQRSSNTFEPLIDRRCVPARNHKSKEAPEIINKYGRSTEGFEILSSEIGRSCQYIPMETNSSGSPVDIFKEKNE